jgi:membrane protease YdiL (CAAX protease family)
MTPVYLAEPDRPFWGFAELLLIAALFISAIFAGEFALQAVNPYPPDDPRLGLPLLVVEVAAYGIVFTALRVLFARHGRPLLESLGWVPQPFRPFHLAVLGVVLTAVAVLLGYILGLPHVEVPMDKLLKSALSRIVISLFGVTLAPIIEELLFRGFLQPVLVDSFGVLPGILVTSAIFGAVHLPEYGYLWQSGVMLTLVGFVFGVVRHVSGSTRASAITHVSYNALPVLALLLSGSK